MSNRAWILLLALAVLWGGSFFLIELLVPWLDPLWVVVGRVAVGAAGLIAFNLIRGHSMPTSLATWRDLAIMGVLNNAIPFGFICWGQTRIEGGVAAILNATTPLFAVILAAVFLSERLTVLRILGVLAGLVGVTVMVGPDVLVSKDGQAIGQLAILVAAISYAFAGVWGRRLKELPVSVSAAGMLICSTVLTLPLAMVFAPSPDIAALPMGAILSMIGLGLLCTSIAYLLYFEILRIAGSTNLMLVTFLIPVTALALGITFLGERPGLGAWLGMALIFLGLALVDGRLFSRRESTGG